MTVAIKGYIQENLYEGRGGGRYYEKNNMRLRVGGDIMK